MTTRLTSLFKGKILNMFAVFLVVLVAGSVVADYIIAGEDGPIYVHSYINENITSCDAHWLRPRINYELGFYPEWISISLPQIDVGFNFTLSKEEVAQLDAVIANYEVSCNEPSRIYNQFRFHVDPQYIEKRFETVAGVKPFYYSDGKTIYVLLLNPTTIGDRGSMKDELCDMWIEEAR